MSIEVSTIMTSDVITVDPNMTVFELDRLLVLCGVSGAPVVEAGHVVGVVSRADVIRALFDEQRGAGNISGFYTSPFPISIPSIGNLINETGQTADHMTQMSVREIMSTDVKSVSPGDRIAVVARLMSEHGYHRVPVLNGSELVGIVTSLDLVRLLSDDDGSQQEARSEAN